MNKTDIINQVVQSQVVEKVSSSLYNVLKDNKKDFILEIYMIILEMPEDKLILLYDNNALYFYIVKIAQNQALYYKSEFNKKIKQSNIKKINIDNIDIENYE